MSSIAARKPTYSRLVRLESYVLTIDLGGGDCDLQTPATLWVILGWLKVNAGITIKD